VDVGIKFCERDIERVDGAVVVRASSKGVHGFPGLGRGVAESKGSVDPLFCDGVYGLGAGKGPGGCGDVL